MTPGMRSSEFLVSLAGLVGGLCLSVATDNVYTQLIGGLLAAVCGASYTLGRTYLKSRTGVAESQAKVIAQAVLKKKSET